MDAACDWEDVLENEAERRLLARQTECTFIGTGRKGHPAGVAMNFMRRRASLWLTATELWPREAAVRRDPRGSVVITSMWRAAPSAAPSGNGTP